MSEERLMILRLLEQGKISEVEAEQLLDALGDIEYDQAKQEASSSFNYSQVNLSKDEDDEHNHYHKEKQHYNPNKNKDFEEIFDSLGKKFEGLGEHLEGKMDVFGEQFGKKMMDLGSIFANKSISFAEKIIDVVEKAVDSDTFINVDLFSPVMVYEEVLEKKLEDNSHLSLQFESYNGNISIHKWNEPTIKVTAHISAKEGKYDSANPIFTLNEDNNSIYFYPRPLEGAGVKLKVEVPEGLYNLIKAQTTNGSISAENLNCNRLLLQTKNGSIKINNIHTQENTSCTTTNGKIVVEKCKAENLLAATKNGRISIENSTIKRIEGLTSNSKITVIDIAYNLLQSLSLKTTNSKIEVIGTVPENTGFSLEANTTQGNINIGIPVVYSENIKTYSNHRVHGKTSNFDKCETIANIKAYTTNSNIYLF